MTPSDHPWQDFRHNCRILWLYATRRWRRRRTRRLLLEEQPIDREVRRLLAMVPQVPPEAFPQPNYVPPNYVPAPANPFANACMQAPALPPELQAQLMQQASNAAYQGYLNQQAMNCFGQASPYLTQGLGGLGCLGSNTLWGGPYFRTLWGDLGLGP